MDSIRKYIAAFCLLAALTALFSACSVRSVDGQGMEVNEANVSADKKNAKYAEKKSSQGNKGVNASESDLIPEPASEASAASLEKVYAAIGEADAVCGVAFVGYADPNASIPVNIEGYGLLTDSATAYAYPFLKELTPEQCASECLSELYCVVPSRDAVSVTAVITEMTAEAEPSDAVESTVYKSNSCRPFYVCAESNGWDASNVLIFIRLEDGSELKFRPCLYANLGTVVESEGVFDFTVYPEQPIDSQ